MNFKKSSAFLCASLLSFQGLASSSYDPTNDLITAYCANEVGEHTQSALNQAEALKDVIEKIKDDPACNDVQAMSTNLYRTLNELGSLYQQNQNSLQYQVNRLGDEIQLESSRLIAEHVRAYKETHPGASESEIMTEKWNFVPNSPLLTGLQSNYAQAKINLISSSISSEDPTRPNEQDVRLQYIQRISTGVEGLFGALKSSSECSKNYGNLLSQMGAQVLGAANTIYGGMVGASLLAGSVFISGTSELITHIRYNSKINKLTNTRLQFAVGCSLEGIARTYCESRDTQTLLDNIINYPTNTKTDNVFTGVQILTYDIIPYNKWVQRIVAGSNPMDSAQASERIAAFTFKNNLTASKESIKGYINETQNRINNLTGTPEAIRAQTNNLLIALIGNLISVTFPYSSSAGKNAYSAPYAYDLDCGPTVYFYSLGTNRVKPPTASTQTCSDYVRATYPQNIANPPSTNKLRELVDALNREADAFANSRISQVLEENPRLVMALYDSEDPISLTTARSFVNETLDYLAKFRATLIKEKNAKLIRLIESTAAQLNRASDIIASEGEEMEQLSQLAVLLAPSRITLSVNNALKEIVKQDVDMNLKNGTLSPEELRYLLKASSISGSELFSQYYASVQSAYDDAAIAKNMTKKNLEVFGSLFADTFAKNLKRMREEWEKNQSQDIRKQLGINCIQTLLVPESSELIKDKRKTIAKACKGMSYISTNPKYVSNLSYDELSRLSFEERACLIYDFKRKVALGAFLKP